MLCRSSRQCQVKCAVTSRIMIIMIFKLLVSCHGHDHHLASSSLAPSQSSESLPCIPRVFSATCAMDSHSLWPCSLRSCCVPSTQDFGFQLGIAFDALQSITKPEYARFFLFCFPRIPQLTRPLSSIPYILVTLLQIHYWDSRV